MLTSLLLGLTLALPFQNDVNHVYISGGAGVEYDAFDQGSIAREVVGQGFAGVTIHPFGVVDDDAAPDLQPFLQRALAIHVGGGGGAVETTPLSSSVSFGSANLSVEGYPHRNVYLAGRLVVNAQTGANPTGMFTTAVSSVSPLGAIGLRIHDVLVVAGWTATAQRRPDGSLGVGFYGGAFGSVTAVLRRRFLIQGSINGRDGGAGASVGFTAYLQRRLFLGASIHGGGFNANGTVGGDLGGTVGAGVWIVPRFGLSVAYSPSFATITLTTGLSGAPESTTQHLVTVSLFGRR